MRDWHEVPAAKWGWPPIGHFLLGACLGAWLGLIGGLVIGLVIA